MGLFLKPGIGSRLKEERDRLGLSQTAFAGLASTSKSTQIRYESDEGAGLDVTYLKAIQAAGVDVEYVLTAGRAIDPPRVGSKMERSGKFATVANLEPTGSAASSDLKYDTASDLPIAPRPYAMRPATTRLPYYDLRAAAGAGQINEHGMEEVAAFEVPTNWLRNDLGIDPNKALVMKVVGDSMEPHIRSGEMVIVDRAATAVKTDGIYVFEHGGVTQVKRLQCIHGEGVQVISENSKYRSYLLPESRLSELHLVGRVAFFGRLT